MRLLLIVLLALQIAGCSSLPAPEIVAPLVGSAGLPKTGFLECPQFFPGRTPPDVPHHALQRELCFEHFAVLHSGQTRTPVFVAEKLNRASLQAAQKQKRVGSFFADARLPRAERAELSDYKGSGFARGHMAPSADMPNAEAMAQSYSLANVVPQNQRQNAGSWNRIEQDTRRYVMRAEGDVFVITGPVFKNDGPVIGFNKVGVPSHLFKLVYDSTTHRAWAHWQGNAQDASVAPPISYEALTQRLGMTLLPAVTMQQP